MRARFRLFVLALSISAALCVVSAPPISNVIAQSSVEKTLRPDRRRVLVTRPSTAGTSTRPGAYLPQRSRAEATPLARPLVDEGTARRTLGAGTRPRRPARPAPFKPVEVKNAQTARTTSSKPSAGISSKDSSLTLSNDSSAVLQVGIQPGTPLSRVLHVSQLSLVNSAGTH
jgi:hypothetical protein